MNVLNSKSDTRWPKRLAIALLITIAFVSSSLPVTDAQRTATPRLNEDQRILHVLNRLGFGARPGDIERVKAMGLDNYINQQLWPNKIDDSSSEAKLRNLETLRMPT